MLNYFWKQDWTPRKRSYLVDKILYKPAVVFDLLLLQEVDTLPDYLVCLFIFDCFKVSIFAASFFTKNLAMFTHEVKNVFASFCCRIMLSPTVVYLSRFLCFCISLLDVLVTLATGYVTSPIIAVFKNIFWSGVWHLQTADCRPHIVNEKTPKIFLTRVTPSKI